MKFYFILFNDRPFKQQNTHENLLSDKRYLIFKSFIDFPCE